MNELVIETPEGVVIRAERATKTQRALAFLVDMFLIYFTLVLAFIVGLLIEAVSNFGIVLGATLVVGFLLQHGYFIFFEARSGTTPGKRLVGARVVSSDGGKLSLEAIIARNLLRDLELFVPAAVVASPEQVFGNAPGWVVGGGILWLFAIMLIPFLSKDGSRAGDLIGGTAVIQVPRVSLERDQGRTSLIPKATNDALVFRDEELRYYGEHELEKLADLLHLYEQERATEDDLRVIATTIAQRVGHESAYPTVAPEQFLRSFYKMQRGSLEKRLVFGHRKSSKRDE